MEKSEKRYSLNACLRMVDTYPIIGGQKEVVQGMVLKIHFSNVDGVIACTKKDIENAGMDGETIYVNDLITHHGRYHKQAERYGFSQIEGLQIKSS